MLRDLGEEWIAVSPTDVGQALDKARSLGLARPRRSADSSCAPVWHLTAKSFVTCRVSSAPVSPCAR